MQPIDNPTPRQTLSHIRELLRSRRIIPKNKMGQNFLIDMNLLDLAVRAAELDRSDAVLEVGTGTGGLTAKLSELAGTVVSVELDPEFQRMACDQLEGRGNVHLLQGDILARKNELNPRILTAWEAEAVKAGCTRRKLVANLPYAVATPVIANLLISDIPIERMVVMVQWEVAERMVAVPGKKDYGALAVLVRSLADAEIIRRLGPTVFWPMPQVDSAIVRIRPNPEKRKRVPNTLAFRAFLRDLYTHRRKNLRQSLCGWPSGRKDKDFIDAKLAEMGIDGTLRAETMDVETHLRLAAAFGDSES